MDINEARRRLAENPPQGDPTEIMLGETLAERAERLGFGSPQKAVAAPTPSEALTTAIRQQMIEFSETLHENLQYATEFRISCPDPADPDRPEGAPALRPEALIVRKCTTNWADRYPDGWMILNPNLQPGDHIWTGKGWEYRGQVFAGVIYQWSRDEAIAEAQRLAVEETARFEKWLAEMRAGKATS